MTVLRYVTHPNVTVDPTTPVPQWSLDATGVARAQVMADQLWTRTVRRIITSEETKAVQTAEILAARLRLDVEVRPGLGENDRSATGYLPAPEFELTADQFFATPEDSVRGWERAVDAQRRIVEGLADLFESPTPDDTVVIGHGGVGTLLYCWLTRQPISRDHDQPGQGHYFSVDLSTGEVLHPWRPIDAR